MTESVEQAALRRAAELDDLPAPWGSVLRALEASERLNDSRFRHVQDLAEQIAELHTENAELRDGMLALSNRIEAVNRDHRALYGAYMAHIESTPHVA